MSALLDAVIVLEDRLVSTACLLEAFDTVAGESPPSWLLVVGEQVRSINAALELVSTLSRESS